MTHTHHRRGSKRSLEHDFIVLAMIDPAVEAQHTYCRPIDERVNQLLKIFARFKPIALTGRDATRRFRYLKGWTANKDTGIHQSSTLEEVTTCTEMESVGHAVYTSKEAIVNVLSALRDADLGISIVVSGVFDEVFDCCRQSGLVPHTVNMSLGTWGRTDRLPKGAALELCTMCGHAMISRRLAEKMIDRVKKGAQIPEDAAVELGKQCTCNIFNTVRGAQILQRLTQP